MSRVDITDLIKRAGDRLCTQALANNFVSAKCPRRAGRDAQITFVTEPQKAQQLMKQVFCGTQPDYVGLVLWIPVECFADRPSKEEKK